MALHEPETPEQVGERLASELIDKLDIYLSHHEPTENYGFWWAPDAPAGVPHLLLTALDAYIDHRIQCALASLSIAATSSQSG